MTIVPFLNRVNDLIINPLIALVFALSFAYFIYSIVRFLRLEAGDKSRKEAQDAIIWGIVGMVIMFSVYGIIYFVLATFGVNSGELPTETKGFLKL
jgi:heme/copper-type cytochrome/quinol oxidase subunit 4